LAIFAAILRASSRVSYGQNDAKNPAYSLAGAVAGGSVLMVLTDRDDVRGAENEEELLTFDVSDDALERAAPVVGGQATVTLVYGTAVVGNCGCPI
jgi:hypothetical protein